MPRFSYTARNRSGQSVADTLEASNRKDALRLLSARGLQPIRVDESSSNRPAAKKSSSRADEPKARAASPSASRSKSAQKLTRAERLPFLQALEDLISSGLSAGEGLRLLSQRLQEPKLKALCSGLWERLGEGATLSRALGDFPEVFDSSTINLIQAGEATGSLQDVLTRLIKHLTEQQEMRRQLVSAMLYPVTLLFVACGVVLFFLFFLLPKLQGLFNSLGGKLPMSTQLLVGASQFALHYGIFVAGALIFGAVSFWRWRATAAGRETTDAWALKLPIAGPFFVSQTVLAISQTLSVLLENGITTVEALKMTAKQITNVIHRRAFDEAIDRVVEGEGLSRALERTHCFPPLVLDQLAIGENTGNIVPSLKKISVNYQKIVSGQLGMFTKVLASGVLMGVFLFVGFLAFSIVSAVFQLSASFK
ncbi:MAG: type II secretion system F family protein [Nibricoccus sp.]